MHFHLRSLPQSRSHLPSVRTAGPPSISSSVCLILSLKGSSLPIDPSNSVRGSGSRLAGSIVQLLAVLFEHRQKALVIVLVVALKLCLGREVLDLCAQVALQPAQEAFDLRLLLPGSSPAFFPPGRPGESCTTSERSCSAMKLPASSLGRPLPGGQDLGVLAIGVKLLAGPGRARVWDVR
jgi:hypothetical protein